MVNWIQLAFPFIYLGVLVGALSTFSSLYRRRKAYRAFSLAPWFPTHRARDIYLSLLHMDGEDEKSKVPDSILKAALLRRAQEDVSRVVQLRQTKPALSTLLQRGSIGDDLWTRFLRAEQELEAEVRDVMSEANAFQEGWGQYIFQSANEMAQNQLIRDRMAELQSTADSEREWWERKRAEVQKDFLKELDHESNTSSTGVPGKALSSGSKGSDDEVVMVETPPSSSGAGVTGNASGGGKKKKNKK